MRRAQLAERRWARKNYPLEENRAFDNGYVPTRNGLANELKRQYTEGTDQDRLIIDLYREVTKAPSTYPNYHCDDMLPGKLQDFMSRVEPMSNDELAEELRKASEALKKKTAAYIKKMETERSYKGLPLIERYKRQMAKERQDSKNYYWANREKLLAQKKRYRQANREKLLAQEKRYRERRKEQRRLEAEQQQRQVFPSPENA